MVKPMSRGLSFPAHKWMDALQRFSRDSPEILQKLPAILQRHQFDTKIGRQLIKSTPSCGGRETIAAAAAATAIYHPAGTLSFDSPFLAVH